MDVKRSLNCDASEQQLWLVFFCLTTDYCVCSKFFCKARKWLVFAFVKITLVCWCNFLWKFKPEMVGSKIYNLIIDMILLLAYAGTYKQSCYLGTTKAIFILCNPAFGGRGSGIIRSMVSSNLAQQRQFDSTKGFPGEGWSKNFPQLTLATWNCRSITFERLHYCRSLGYDVLALTEL